MKRNQTTTGRRTSQTTNYTIIVRCISAPTKHPEWLDKEWVRGDDPAMLHSHNQAHWPEDHDTHLARLANSAGRIARTIQANEGGRWIARLRDASCDPYPQQRLTRQERLALDRHIANGPDGPGRRFLENIKGKPTASKLDALTQKLKAPTPTPQILPPPKPKPVMADDDFWNDRSDLITPTTHREPGQDDDDDWT